MRVIGYKFVKVTWIRPIRMYGKGADRFEATLFPNRGGFRIYCQPYCGMSAGDVARRGQ